MRDLGSVDPWQASLERSLARRGKHPQASEPLVRRGGRPQASEPERPGPARGARTRRRSRRHPLAQRSHLLAVSSWAVLGLTVVMIAVAGILDGHGAQASAHAPETHAPAKPTPSPPAHAAAAASGIVWHSARNAETCGPVPQSSGYVNPVAGDVLTGERIDQGVDYAGTGTLTAIGTARLTYVGTSATGWPGAFIEYRLLDGPDAGCFVYYAEGIAPTAGLRAGQTVQAGQVLANIIPGWSTGIELGWGGGDSTKTYAAKAGKWTTSDDANSVASQAGKTFSALIVSLGGPAGRVEG